MRESWCYNPKVGPIGFSLLYRTVKLTCIDIAIMSMSPNVDADDLEIPLHDTNEISPHSPGSS